MITPLNIFISHASDCLTDCEPHGDGLVADYFIRNLMARGHNIHVAVNKCVLREQYASNVQLHLIETGKNLESAISRLRFVMGVRALLARLSQDLKFDVVHQLNPVVTGLSLGLWGTGIPIVLGPYVPAWRRMAGDGKPEHRNPKEWLMWLLKVNIWQLQHRIASGIIVSTPAALDKMRDPSVFQSKIHVIPIGVNSTAFTPSPLPDKLSILFINPSRRKGVFVMLEAFRIVLKAIPEAVLVIAGTSPEAESVKQMAAKLDMLSSIVFRGAFKREEVPIIMRDCTLLCVPSFGEPFGQVTLEAMACGRPIVGTDAGGLSYLISERGGIKAPPGNSEQLADALLRILNDPAMARSMGEHNRRTVEEQYAWPSVISRLEDAYSAVLMQPVNAKLPVGSSHPDSTILRPQPASQETHISGT